jgi:hypothetical protein
MFREKRADNIGSSRRSSMDAMRWLLWLCGFAFEKEE